MSDTATLPRPEKRKGFTARDVAAVFIKYEARCAKCREKVSLGNYQIDHIQRLDALGKHELENWQLLCSPCHSGKTKVDNREAKKGARVRGETGQRARRERRGHGAIAALPPQVSPELIEKLGKLANYLTEQGEYEACDLIDTVVERVTPKTKG